MSRLERSRIQDANDDIDALRKDSSGSSSVDLVQTITVTTYPALVSAFFAVTPLLVDGTEREGAVASFTPDPSRTFYAYNMGTQIPPPGTKLLVAEAGGRKVFRYDG